MKTYWTKRDGERIDVDLMDEKHLKNTLKMIINKEHRKEKKSKFKYPEEEERFNDIENMTGETWNNGEFYK